MKFLRVGEKNKEIPAILDKENKIRSLSNYINDFNPDTLNFNTIDKIKNLDFKVFIIFTIYKFSFSRMTKCFLIWNKFNRKNTIIHTHSSFPCYI